jgi:hypothetical protein
MLGSVAAPVGLLSSPKFELGFVTDCEGNLAYFDRWVRRSRVLRYRPGTKDTLELTHSNAFFVYVMTGQCLEPSLGLLCRPS